jgi:hypothetical protein
MPAPRKAKAKVFQLPPELALERILTLDQCEDVNGLSQKTMERDPEWCQHIIRLSKNRKGMRLKHALRLAP